MKLSIIVPVYNEEKTIKRVLKKIIGKDFGIEKEINLAWTNENSWCSF